LHPEAKEVTVRTFYPRLEPEIQHEVARHLQLIYSRLNNHGLAMDSVIRQLLGAGIVKSATKATRGGVTASAAAVGQTMPHLAPASMLLAPQVQSLLAPEGGGVSYPYTEAAADYTIDAGADFLINCTSGTFIVTLPDATGLAGQMFAVKNSGAGTITLAAASGQTIDGSATKTLIQWDNRVVMSTGAGWIVFV
jgi:hypothetical protein